MTKERIHKVEELPEEITQNTEERNEQLGIRKEKMENGGNSFILSSVQFSSSVVSNSLQPTTWTAVCQASLSITNSQSLLKLMSTELVMPSNHLILCHPLSPPTFNLSQHQGLSKLVLCIKWPKYWSFTFSISPSNEYSGLISFRMDWLDLFAIQGILESLLQHHSSKASILQCSSFLYSPTLTSTHDHWKNHRFD